MTICSCHSDIEKTSHFFIYCSNLLEKRSFLLSKKSEINSKIITCTDSKIVETFLLSDTLFNQLDDDDDDQMKEKAKFSKRT